MNFVGLFCRDLGENDKAAFFFHQFKIVADTSVLLKEKVSLIMYLGLISYKSRDDRNKNSIIWTIYSFTQESLTVFMEG